MFPLVVLRCIEIDFGRTSPDMVGLLTMASIPVPRIVFARLIVYKSTM